MGKPLESTGENFTWRATIAKTALAPDDCGPEKFMVRDATRILKQTGRSVSESFWILLFHEWWESDNAVATHNLDSGPRFPSRFLHPLDAPSPGILGIERVCRRSKPMDPVWGNPNVYECGVGEFFCAWGAGYLRINWFFVGEWISSCGFLSKKM